MLLKNKVNHLASYNDNLIGGAQIECIRFRRFNR